nr:hypothetical protein [Candidatus Sigynarchaeota archaeon]
MAIIMHVDASPIPEGIVESSDDAWEEIEHFSGRGEKSYILLEDRKSADNFLAEMGVDGWYDFPRLSMTPVAGGKWGVIINDDPEKVVTVDELKSMVKDFFAGKFKLEKEQPKTRAKAKKK